MVSNFTPEYTWIFVDDDDPGIVYNGPWVVSKVLQEDLPNIPLHGTVHTAELRKAHHQLSYRFNGTSFRASFIGFGRTEMPTPPCKIDGVYQSVTTYERGFRCFSNDALSQKEHTFSVSLYVDSYPVSFDGLFITTPKLSEDTERPFIPKLHARAPQFGEFTSIVGGIVSDFTSLLGLPFAAAPSEASSLTVASTQFSITTPLIQTPSPTASIPTSSSTAKSTQLIFPSIGATRSSVITLPKMTSFSRAEPSIFSTPSSATFTSILPTTTIFHSSTSVTDPNDTESLSSVTPSITSSSSISTESDLTASQASDTRKISQGGVVGVAVGAVALLLILAWFGRRTIYRKRAIKDHKLMVQPFSSPDLENGRRPSLSRYSPVKYGQSAGLGPGPILYHVHEDGRTVDVNDRQDGCTNDADVISLPPTYGGFRTPHPYSASSQSMYTD